MERKALLSLALVFAILENAGAGSAVVVSPNPAHSCLTTMVGLPESVAVQKALARCRERGGTNPRLLAATDRLGYGAIAIAAQPSGHGSFVGIALAKRSKAEAEQLALLKCLKRGGRNVKVIDSWRDGGNVGDVFNKDTYLRVSDLLIQGQNIRKSEANK